MSGGAEREAVPAAAASTLIVRQRQRLLVVLVGIPGAGKSTVARLLSERAGKDCAVWHIEFDALLQRTSNPNFEPQAWKESREAFIVRLQDALLDPGGPQVVVADDTFHYKSMRRRCYQVAQAANAAYCQIFLKCPLEIAEQRNLSRSPRKQVPAAVLARLHAIMESPAESACPWDRHTRVVLPELDVEALWAWLRDRWAAHVPRQPATPAPVPVQSPVHDFDIRCRQAISATVLGALPAKRAALAAALNRERRVALEQFRTSAPDRSLDQALAAFCTRVGAVARHGG